MKHSILFSIILLSSLVAVTLAGCKDDFIDKTVDISDREVELQGEVIFKPLVPVEVQTRAEAPEGNKYKGINSLYIFFFDAKGEPVTEYSGDVDFTPEPSEGSTHERVTFKKRVKAGYYYIFAVANISQSQKSDLAKVASIESLRNFKLVWDDDIANDLEMFGVFKIADTETPSTPNNESFEENQLLTIDKSLHIHSWVRRAVSKVTVDFDGTGLKDNVTVYIKSAVLKDVASGALLGSSPSKADSGSDTEETADTDEATADNGGITCIPSKYSIDYGTGESYSTWLQVTKGTEPTASFHDDNAKALPCYENMQGTHEDKSKLQDSNEDGIIDSETKDGVENGTYLEVEGYYVSSRPEYKSEGKIIYRFMLGNNETNNFDLVRNHHYKITMNFKGYGNDIDWHIEYAEKYLDATYPEDVNYQGKFFVPDINYQADMANAGHAFSDENVITVTSFETTDGKTKNWKEPEISYTYYSSSSYNDQTGEWEWDADNTTEWLTPTEGTLSDDNSQRAYTFTASMATPTDCTINSLFSGSKGSDGSPYNLSNSTGGSGVENTANCYMVDASGWYCFPLVYGNAITDGGTNAAAYNFSTSIVNHLNEPITAPYIKDNTRKDHPETKIDLSDVSVKLIWQDVQGLVSNISYDSNLFDGKGGIKFRISDNIKEGNAVIALIDNKAEEDQYVDIDRPTYGKSGSTKAVWSWHIWTTRFGSDNFEKNIRITNHDEKAFDVMPVNLGWCSGDKAIRYYKRRKCDIKFKVGEHEIIRTIVQYPHFVLPRGDHPYYQWGRKDPFVGSNELWKNKPRWTDTDNYGERGDFDPPRLYNEPESFSKNINRKNTVDCLEVLIKNPDKWHNAKRWPHNENDYTKGFYSINESPTDLWSNNGIKTVYDPCPAGYQVSDNTVFTGITTLGIKATFPYDWYDVLESNMEQDYYPTDISVNRQVLELYTDTRKLQSIAFPVTGYRDYDGHAQVVQYPNASEDVSKNVWGQSYVWFNCAENQTNSYHLKLQRNDIQSGKEWYEKTSRGESIIDPSAYFYNTDGFGIRPVSIKQPTQP